MSTESAIETEVKIPLPTWTPEETRQRLENLGFRVAAERLFESNGVYDTPQQSLRQAGTLLRLRRAGDRNILTWKGPVIQGPHKSRQELEVTFDSFETMHTILAHLGYAEMFRYEKYRTEFEAGNPGTITLDETPIGNYLELEGPAVWIDETAARLGFKPEDYVLESYSRLYQIHCEKAGVQPLNMVFSPRH